MNIEKPLNEALDALHPDIDGVAVAKKALPLLDLTRLERPDEPANVDTLCRKAVTDFGYVAAVCVYPEFIKTAVEIVHPPVKIATVVNFPAGESSIDDVIQETQQALQAGADEIDLVMPYKDFLKGDIQTCRDMLAGVKRTCGDKSLKVILESGAMVDPQLIYLAGLTAFEEGADFIKTSTGKIPQGASLDACGAMLLAVKELTGQDGKTRGVKVSGGIRTTQQAAAYINLVETIMGEHWLSPETFRFGASSLLDDLLEQLK